MFLKLINLLSASHIKLLIVILFFSLIASILDILSVATIVPLINLILDPNYYNNIIFFFNKIFDFYPILGFNILYYILALIFCIFILKTLFITYQIYLQSSLLVKIKTYFQELLFKKYIFKNYDFHIKSNSSQLIRNIYSETNQLVNLYLSCILNLILEFLILIGIMLFLFYFQTLLTFYLMIYFISLIIGYYLLIHKKFYLFGDIRSHTTAKLIKIIQETFQGIKDIKIFKSENFFYNKFKPINIRANLNERNERFLSSVFKYWFEMMIIIPLLVFIFIYHDQDNSANKLLITNIAVFAAATFKLLPSINKIMFNIQTIRSSIVPSKNVLNELSVYEKYEKQKHNSIDKINKINFEFINFENVSFQYNNKELILKNIYLSIKKNDIIGLFGKSGAGKTTFVDLLVGFHKPTTGNIIVNNKNLENIKSDFLDIIGYVPQSVFLLDDTIKNNIIFGNNKKFSDNYLNEIIELSQLNDFINNLDDGIDTIVGEKGSRLSGGQIQRIGIARALYQNPQFLILDEATNALDEKTEKNFLNVVENLKDKLTIIIISHKKSNLDICNKVLQI